MQICTFLPRSIPIADREMVITYWRTPKPDRWRVLRLMQRMAAETAPNAEGAQPIAPENRPHEPRRIEPMLVGA